MQRKWFQAEKCLIPWFDANRSTRCSKWLNGTKPNNCAKTDWPRFMTLPRLPRETATIRGKNRLQSQIVGIRNHAKTRVIIGLQPSDLKIYRTDVIHVIFLRYYFSPRSAFNLKQHHRLCFHIEECPCQRRDPRVEFCAAALLHRRAKRLVRSFDESVEEAPLILQRSIGRITFDEMPHHVEQRRDMVLGFPRCFPARQPH